MKEMFRIPEPVRDIGRELHRAGFKAYLVGGSLRDLLLGREPKDWDIATDATPDKVQEIFPESVYENEFGTVGIKTGSEEPELRIVEVTTFRNEGRYTDQRHPDEVRFAKTIEEDLSRRDFTVNAIALDLQNEDLVDPHGGEADIRRKIIRTVGDSEARLTEDALRLMRAARLATELGFEIEKETAGAIRKHAGLLAAIAAERIRDELIKLLMSPNAAEGFQFLEDLGLLPHIMPELREGIGVGQNKHHIYTVWEHNINSLDYAAKQGYSLLIRVASLLHDVGKPRTKGGDGPDSTFYGHEVVGAKMAVKMLDRLRFPKDFTEKAAHLIRRHMFYYNVGDVSPAGVRRFLVRVGPENIDDLLQVREADRIGSGVKKAVPYKLRHLLFMIEKVKHDPISPKMLQIDGEEVMHVAEIPPSPKVGQILAALLDEVLDDPVRNTKDYLEKRARELDALSPADLAALAAKSREKQKELEEESEGEMKRKFRV